MGCCEEDEDWRIPVLENETLKNLNGDLRKSLKKMARKQIGMRSL